MLAALADQLSGFDTASDVRAVVIAGSDKVFASGADLRDLAAADSNRLAERARLWDRIRRTQTPLVAAVSGFCLGGGCELALICDIVVASESARFGLPETKLGLIPGAGGTQRLTRAIGKAKTMEVVLAGRLLSAAEAEAAGLVARVAAPDGWLEDALAIAHEIAARSPVAIRLAKDAVNQSFETPLEAGLTTERERFATAFASEDAREGIAAFLEKREPTWQGR